MAIRGVINRPGGANSTREILFSLHNKTLAYAYNITQRLFVIASFVASALKLKQFNRWFHLC